MNVYLALKVAPEYLSQWLNPHLAYGMTSFLLFVSMYWVPPLYPVSRKDGWWQWALVSVGVVLLLGWAMPFSR